MSSGFDKIAPFYGILESFLFGSKLQQMRCVYLDRLSERRHIVLIGEGTGMFLERLLEVNPNASVTVVEQSAGMIERSRNRVAEKDSSRVHFLKVSLEEFKPVRRFDAVCTFFFWDCFEESQIKIMLPVVSQCVERESLWMDVDFFEAQKGVSSTISWQFVLIRMLYGFFRLAAGIEAGQVVEIKPLAKQNGFCVTSSYMDETFPIRARIFQQRNLAKSL